MTKSYNDNTAFTLIEMLVVVSIIVLLIAMLVPALGKTRDKARDSVCAHNERQLGLALQVYATSNARSMPYHPKPFNGSWMWDMTEISTDLLAATGDNKLDLFYCPTNPEQTAQSLWTFGGSFRVTGFFFAIKRANGHMSGRTTFSGTGRPWVRRSTTKMHDPSELELVTDGLISQNGSFNIIYGGWNKPHQSSHLNGSTPRGGNILTLDGHVEWRDFQDMALQHWGPDHWF